MKTTFIFIKTFFAVSFFIFFLSGCDQIRNTMQSVFKPKSVEETLQVAQTALAAGDFKKAISEAENIVQQGGQNQGDALLLIARSASLAGNIDQALAYLLKAMQVGAIEPTEAMILPDFEALRTDTRFLSMVAGFVSGDTTPTPTPPTATEAEPQKHFMPSPKPVIGSTSGGVSAQIGDDGASARAGDVSVRIAP